MEVKEEKATDQRGETKIPVFTVLKNGAILKNIFVVNSPDSFSPEKNGGSGDDHHVEEILLVGRHPDCTIMLTHPSISRFHLQIRSIPSRQKLSVTDLSSVHGTWVSDQKLEPGTCVEMKEGDTIRIGGSTRIYRLHWIPLSHAYDMDNPFVSPLDIHATKEQEEEDRVLKAENVEVTHEDGRLASGEGEAPQLDWTSDGTGSSMPSEDPDSIVKETSSLSLAFPSHLPVDRDFSEMLKQQFLEDAPASPNFVTDIVEVEAGNPRTSCLASKQQNGGYPEASSSSLFAEIADDESLHLEDKGETEVVSRQVMDVSSGFFAVTESLLEIKAKDIRGPILGWQPPSEIQSELVNEVDNQSLHQEDNGEYEVFSKQVMAVSESFTATESLSETKSKAIRSPFLGWQPLSEIQSELPQQDDNKSLHQADDGEMDLVSRQVMPVSSRSFLDTEPFSETKNEQIQDPSLCWQPLSESQSGLADQADNKSLHQEDDREADVISRKVVAASSSCTFPETEPSLETKSKYIQDPFLGWHPLVHIESEVKPSKDQNQKSGMAGGTEELLDEANNLRLSKGCEQSELWSSLSTNQHPKAEQLESVMDIGSGGGSEEAYSLSGLESHQYNEKLGFITATLAAEESANLSQPDEDIFSDVTGGKENPTQQSHAVRGVISETENLRHFRVESAKRSSASNNGSRRGKSAGVLQMRTKRSEGKEKRIGGNCKAHLQKFEVKNDKSISPSLHASSEKLEPEIFTPDKENLSPNTHILKRLQEIGDIKEHKSSSLHAGSEKLESEIFTPDKENLTPNARILKRLQEVGDIKESKSSLKAASRPLSLKIPSSNEYASGAVREPEIFTPDKENLTPSSHMLKRLQEVGKLQENKDSSKATRKLFLSKVFFSPDIHSEENVVPVEKENQSSFCNTSSQSELKHEEVLPKRKTERAPFQPLLEKSSAKSVQRAEPSSAAMRNGNSRGSRPSSILSGEKSKMKWTIVVDTSSLLNRESRKSLQLLQGLKGTRLVIPRTVLRELDERKRSCGLFFRRTTDVFSALEWIQECMVETKWWVHLQSSSEEAGPTAPTPPASPSLFSDSSAFPFSLYQAAPEIVSPTSEDNVLECALLYRKRNRDGQLVLLCNDVTLKIKAMAEGVICETAQEFYESLVNPFSSRFMWTESSPRGQTWCHLDDVVLRERYKTHSFPRKKSSKGESSAKGLKLILLHNSHYGHNTSKPPKPFSLS